MNIAQRMKRDPVDRMFRAFADPTRLRLLCLLQDGEHCVSDLIEILKEPQAKVSRHLIYLSAAGLVESRRQGLWSFYRLSPPRSTFHRKLLECLGECFSGVPGLAADKRRAAKLRESGGCCPAVIREESNRCGRASGCGKT
jgi:ArsR family transcriptional regulator, arsenate/arsenite/antimonite-responsive transcriptional repressor